MLPHHNNVRTTTVVVVVVHTLHSYLKNDRTRTVIRTSKCTVPMIPKKFEKKNFFLEIFFQVFLNFFGDNKAFEQYILSAGAVAVRVQSVHGCGQQPH